MEQYRYYRNTLIYPLYSYGYRGIIILNKKKNGIKSHSFFGGHADLENVLSSTQRFQYPHATSRDILYPSSFDLARANLIQGPYACAAAYLSSAFAIAEIEESRYSIRALYSFSVGFVMNEYRSTPLIWTPLNSTRASSYSGRPPTKWPRTSLNVSLLILISIVYSSYT